MNNTPVYFDNAATTFPKPPEVISAVLECMEEYCGNPGRGSHYLAKKSAETVFMTRESLGEMFGAAPENVIFTLNTTYALNMAIKGVMGNGGHVIISNMEHNSVLRPIVKLAQDKRVTYSIFDGYGKNGSISSKEIISGIMAKLRRDTKMLVCIHSSNICSHTLPIRDIGAFCHRHNILFCVDAAQSAGHIPIDMEKDNVDILCLPAHKGLLAPQGCGILILRNLLMLDTLTEGGNGINSLDSDMGQESPERYESGTLCTPAIAGLYAGLRFLKSFGIANVARHESMLWQRAYTYLQNTRNVTVHDHTPGSVLLFSVNNASADEVGEQLSKRGFCLRTGYHCSALGHKALQTPDGGAARIGFGIFNNEQETDLLCQAIADIARQTAR
ncbi:MAG: aminotransferase class V-fold PLP-dependent enzyme [Clostridia bacterium]|nr:aminotransferase class V-fold PLP-dependent enzyme [Clostridia bacterium]